MYPIVISCFCYRRVFVSGFLSRISSGSFWMLYRWLIRPSFMPVIQTMEFAGQRMTRR